MALDRNTSFSIDNPFLEWMGVTLQEWSPGYAEMHLPALDNLGNRTNRVHGGVLCTLLDSVSGYSGLYAPPGQPVMHGLTLSLTTNFIDSGDGDVLIAKGYLERKGRSVFFTRAEVWMDDSLLMATAVGTFKYLRQR
ncbi:MAG: PaaI family thioesterase [Pusillimonas sp.]